MRFHERAAIAGQRPLFLPDSRWVAPTELPSLSGAKRITVDIETKDPHLRSLGPGFRRGAKIVGLGVGTDDGRRWYLPTGHEGGGNLDEGLVKRWARAELGSFRGAVLGAYLNYDLDGLATCWDVHFKNAARFDDVQVLEASSLDENRAEYNLDALSLDYLGEGKDLGLLREAGRSFGFTSDDAVIANLWRYPASLAGPYAEADVDRPERIFRLQLQKLKLEDQEPVYDLERRLIPILVAMRRRGVRVNMRKVELLRERFVKEVARWTGELKRIAGPTAELMQPDTLGPALRARGIDVPLTRKTGVDSITKVFLERHQKDELARVILNGRKFNTLINTFLDGQIRDHAVDGRVHPTFKQGKDDDGGSLSRFSGSHPNLQFIPARESDWQEDQEVAPLVRSAFEPEDGEEWQRDDQSQIEYRLTVHYAVGGGAEEARRKYNDDPTTDFHKMTADMLGAPPEDKKKRKRVKNTNFAKTYGAMAPKLADTFGCSVEEAEEFVREYEEKLPFTKDTFDACAKSAAGRGYVVTILGRKQRFPFWGPRSYQRKVPARLFRSYDEAFRHYVTEGNQYRNRRVYGVERANTYTGMNRKMQGSAADVMKKWMVDAHEAGVTAVLGPYLITVHDELGTSVPRTREGDEAGKELKRVGESVFKLRVPLMVESERAECWTC